MRRSISDIVAVVLLIVIAIAAAVIIYMWLSGLIGAVHSTSPALSEKVEIVGASISPYSSSESTPNVNVTVMVPQGSSTVNIVSIEVQSTNGTTLCTTSIFTTVSTASPSTTTTATVSPGTTVTLYGKCSLPSGILPGTPLEVVVVTSSGVTASYQTTLS